MRIIFVGAATLAVAAVAMPGLTFSARAQEVTLKFASSGPPQNYLQRRFDEWLKEVNGDPDAKGVLKLVRIPGLTDGRNDYDVFKNGVGDIGLVLHGAASGKFLRTDVAALPFLYVRSSVGSAALWNVYKQGLLAAEYDEVRNMGLFTFPGSALHTKKPVHRLEDFQGMKVRIGGNVFAQTTKALGAAGTYVPYSDVFSAGDSGIVDGIVMAYSGVRALGIPRVVHYSLDVGLGATTAMVCMYPPSWDKLPAAAKAVLAKHTGDRMTELASEANEREEDNNREALVKDPKHKVSQLSAEEQARWEQRVQGVYEAWVKATPDGQKVLDAFKTEVKAAAKRLGKS
jgi:TRAP-type C4-dicarboxylate transport system substrate-binding protein